MRRLKRNPRKVILAVIFIVISVLIFCAACSVHAVKNKVEDSIELMQTVDKQEIEEMTNANISEETEVRLRDRWTIAAFGLDSRAEDGLSSANSDVIMLMTLNGKSGDIKLVSVYRDTCLKTGEGTYRKANSAYASGGPKKAVAMLNENLDLKIDDYIAVNWKSVADAVNILGGIDLEITKSEFKYINSFITETVESTGIPSCHLTSAGMNHLDGVQTVAYCRLRLMDNDFKRTERQRKVLSLLLQKASKANYATLNQLIVTIMPEVSSSIDADDLYAVAKNILKLKQPESSGFPASNYCKTVNGASYVFSNNMETDVSQLHEFLYDTENYIPSQAVKDISKAIARFAERGNVKKQTENEKTTPTESIIEETTQESLEEISDIQKSDMIPNETDSEEAETSVDESEVLLNESIQKTEDVHRYGPGYVQTESVPETDQEGESEDVYME